MATDNYPTIRVTKTELVWPSKFDAQGNVRPVEKAILPFQAVETVNESKTDREDSLLFRQRGEEPETWRNKLIWGDNKVVMSSLLPQFEGKIDLIYIDPPFATGQDFSFLAEVGDHELTKEASIIEEKAYRDTWAKYGPARVLESYLEMIYERLALARQLLSAKGSLYVHANDKVGPYLKAILDEVFGGDCFLEQLIWHYPNKVPDKRKRLFTNATDLLLFYCKNRGENIWHTPYYERERPSRQPVFKKVRGEKIVQKDAHGKTVYLEVTQSMCDNVLTVPMLTGAFNEYVYFQTQKPRELLDILVRASSDEGDIVADFFCGSGTTGVVAEELGRRWIMCDLSKWAIQVSRKRLLGIKDCRPFEILNLGNYQRHKLAANGRAGPVRYLKFILDLYRAEVQTGHRMLHGKKGGALVHVGAVDSPITLREIRETLAEAKEAGAREVHFLGWDFEMGLHDLVDQVGDDYALKVRLVSIPRESLEVTDPAKEHLRFYDLNYLDVEAEAKKRTVMVRIKDFAIANPEYLPEEVRERVKKFSDYIDYWAVDWDYQGDTFHNGWQDFRTRKKRALKTEANHEYEESGTYRVLVKVVDVFGNDTTKLLQVKVK